MKSRIYRHLVFWLVYSVQGTLIEYAWIHFLPAFTDVSQLHVVLTAFSFNLALLPSKIAFTYYTLTVAVNQPLKMRRTPAVIIIKLTIALFVAVILHRIANVYYINPTQYPSYKSTFDGIFDIAWMFFSLLDIGYVAGIAAALRLFRMQVLNLKTEKELVKDKLETELKFLRNQINPHFLFNTLNNIYALARKKSDKTPEVVVRLSKLLRFMLYESAKDSIPIAEEIRILEDYVQLEKIRHSNNKLHISFDKEIDNYNQLIAPLILLPFIENAFKHGINESIDESSIDIKVELKAGQLIFFVKNTHDREENKPINANIGLSNVRRQLELMYNDFSLEARSLAKTFFIDLKINLNSNGKI
ncbi:MAG: sensor histidine kinase [Mucilaginibacter sp.]